MMSEVINIQGNTITTCFSKSLLEILFKMNMQVAEQFLNHPMKKFDLKNPSPGIVCSVVTVTFSTTPNPFIQPLSGYTISLI